MIVTILKHHEGLNPNEMIEVDEGLGLYWIACGVATVNKPDNEKIDSTLADKLKKTKKKK